MKICSSRQGHYRLLGRITSRSQYGTDPKQCYSIVHYNIATPAPHSRYTSFQQARLSIKALKVTGPQSHLRKPSGKAPSLCCRSKGISRKWLCLLRMTRSRSLKLLLLYLRYLPKLASTSGPRAVAQSGPPTASSESASS